MAITVAGKNLTVISNCESSSDNGVWLALTTQDGDLKKQGSFSLCGILKSSGDNVVTFTPTTSKNLLNKHVRFWLILTQGKLNTYALGGIQFWCSDGVNTGYWYVGGKDTYPGGFYNFVVDMSRAVDDGTKPSDAGMQAITSMGIRINLTSLDKNVVNTWIDCLCVSDGLVIYGDIDSGVITCNVNAVAGTFTRTAGSFLTDGFKVGQDFTSSGFTNGGNNTTKTISSVTATVITVTDKTGLVDETGNGDERIRGYFDFEDMFKITDTPATGGIGVMSKKAGVYCLTGCMEFGYATSLTKFQGRSQVVVFEDRPDKTGTGTLINPALMNFNIIDSGNALYTTEFILGRKFGGQGIEGCTVRVQHTAQISKFDIFGNNANVDNFKLYGSTFLDADEVTFPPSATEIEILNCSFESCGEVILNTAKTEYCNFVSANGRGARLSSISHGLKNSNFISCPDALRFDVGGLTYPLDAVKFYGNTYDLENTAATAIIASCTNLSNPSNEKKHENPGGITISNDVTLRLTVKDTAGAGLNDVQVSIHKSLDDTELMNEDTANVGGVDGVAEATFNYPGTDVPVYIRARKSTVGNTRYVPHGSTGIIKSVGLDVTITLYQEPLG